MTRHIPLASSFGTGAFLLALAASCAPADLDEAESAESLGVVRFPTTCAPAVQAEFDRGIALLHHMTYPGARSSFDEVIARDPECALAYWGAAMTLFQPLWPNRPTPEALAEGRELMRLAEARASADEREARFIATGAAFFGSEDEPEYWERIERWARAAEATYRADTADLEGAAFFALAQLATSPVSPDPAHRNAEAAALLATILAVEPTHPGAVHYTIHANDFAGREGESLDVVRSYGDIAPMNPHALHMPTHIFVRLGAWDDVIAWNERAAEAALAQRVGPSGEFVWDEFPHAVEYLVYAHLQKGDDAEAGRLIDGMVETPGLQPTFKTAFHVASTAARYAVERKDWDAAAALEPRRQTWLEWDRFPWPEAVVWHAKGLGAAHLGREEIVDESVDRLGALATVADEAGEPLFADQIRILEMEVRAWRSFAAGDGEEALTLLRSAATLERATPKPPVTPGATIPADELIGDMQLAQGAYRAALAAYEASAARAPGRLNTTLGRARASLALNDSTAAAGFYQDLRDASSPESTRPGIVEARAFPIRP